jgi:diguanylate cyclase (GGDEF)-like protein
MRIEELADALLRNRPALLSASGRDVLERRFAQTNIIAAITLAVGGIANIFDQDWRTVAAVCVGLVLIGAFHLLSRRGNTETAAAGLIWVLFGVATFSMLEYQGPYNDAMLAYPTLLFISLMLTSRRNAQILLMAMVIAVAAMVYVSEAGLHTFIMPAPGWNDLVYIGLLLLTFWAVSTLFARDLRMALKALQGEVSRAKQTERHLDHLANHDQLTGLPNRRLFNDRLAQAIAGFQRHGEHSVVLFMDLDNFKSVNDSQGHAAGDVLLQEVTTRLKSQVRETDTASRFGGDEFVLLLERLGPVEATAISRAHLVSEKVLHAMRKPIALNGKEFICTASLGAVLLGADTVNAENVLRHGDLAMYRAKDMGRNCMQFYDPEMQAAVNQRAGMEADLRRAVEQGQIVIYLQPQMDAHGRVMGAEALARWNHPERGFIPPNEFIALAEDMGLIEQLGQQVLDAGCAVLRKWSHRAVSADWSLAVNVSVEQLRRNSFVASVISTMERYGVRAALLELEITESILISDQDATIAKMSNLRAAGVRLALDDFGTGYSSLSYVRRLPLDKLKIDQSFLRNVQTSPQDAAIVITVIGMAKSLGLDVIAEGVETEVQRDFLAANGCSAFQGYFFSRPIPVEEFQNRYCE